MRASLAATATVLTLAAAAHLAAPPTAAAEYRRPPPYKLQRQVQADIGLAVIGLGYEVPVARRLALMFEGQIFGTYFLPWFDSGDNAKGLGGQVRATWFQRPSGHGLYALGYGRVDAVRIDRDDLTANGIGISAGFAAGWAFRLTRRLDLRLGAGFQYIFLRGEAKDGTRLGASTPFPTLDAVLGYRL
jgi:hypothetical protein